MVKKGKFCYACGTTENLTLHHLKHEVREAKIREELGIFLYSGEVIPLCRNCHDAVEDIKSSYQFEKTKLYSMLGKLKKEVLSLEYKVAKLTKQSLKLKQRLHDIAPKN